MALVEEYGKINTSWRNIDTTFACNVNDYYSLLHLCNKIDDNIKVDNFELIANNIYYDKVNNLIIKRLCHINELNNIKEIIMTKLLSEFNPINFPHFKGYNKTVCNCCSNGYHYYLITEKITGKSLFDYIINSNSQQLVDIIEKIIVCLYEVWIKYEFTHYDLHVNNIIITEDHIPKIIDFGTSYIHLNNKHLGYIKEFRSLNGRMNFINQCNSFWLHDIFKILCSIYIVINPYYIIYQALNYKRELMKDISYACIDINNGYYYEYNNDDVNDALTKINDPELSKRWTTSIKLMDDANKQSQQMQNTQKEFRDFFDQIMLFFNPSFNNTWLSSYRHIYTYLQAKPTIQNVQLDFNKFLTYWFKIKSNYKK